MPRKVLEFENLVDEPALEQERKRLWEAAELTRKIRLQKESRGQTEDKPRTNWGQIEDKPETNRGQTEDIKAEVIHKPRTNRGQTGDTTEDKTEDKPRTISPFSSLIGLQRSITYYFYDQCKIRRNKSTGNLTLFQIAQSCETSASSVKKTIQRLENKGILIRLNFKEGRGGWSEYELKERIFLEIAHHELLGKLGTNWRQTEDKLGTQPRTNSPSSSSIHSTPHFSKNNVTTTTRLPDDWQKVDCSELQELDEPFGVPQLKRLYEKGLVTPDQVQESINRVVYAIRNRTQKIKSPTGILMGNLLRGQMFDPPSGYKSSLDEMVLT